MKNMIEQILLDRVLVINEGEWSLKGTPNDLIEALTHLIETEKKKVADKYNELIMAAETKHPTKTRHETALLYIQQAENRESTATQSEELQGEVTD